MVIGCRTAARLLSITFDETPTEPLIPTEINREDTSFLRVMNWNVLNDGLLDPSPAAKFYKDFASNKSRYYLL